MAKISHPGWDRVGNKDPKPGRKDRGSAGGQDQGEGGAGAGAVGVSDDVTSVGSGDSAGDGKPDSASARCRRIGPVETFEDPLQIRGRRGPGRYR